MIKVPDIFQNKNKTYSFELFPPKTEKGYTNLMVTIKNLAGLKPDFISCTYGAGGGNRDKTFDIVQHIQDKYAIASVAHLTCVLNTRDQIKSILNDIQSRNITNILALRGDPPLDNPDWTPGPDNFQYTHELCRFARELYGEAFGIGVAGFPEGHILCPDRDQDARYLKIKLDHGADYVITQFFYNNHDYFEYIDRLRSLGIKARIIPGILPITNFDGLLRFSSGCGTTITDDVKKLFEPTKDDPRITLQKGIDFAVQQCQELLAGGAPGLHFYCLNKLHPVDAILPAVRI
ncbi:MAG: methylenetetrahydrofolate reductase [NAD(P)H] [Candidatus Omnitrophica bacterium]|nr:methylenetetrahydrofolate reductase [NAD(P)H] [Candidatus Omnitrophota bacterium]